MSDQVREIAARVRVLREIEEISSEKLAKELGFTPEEYDAWESGNADFPLGALVEIASRFNVDLAELVSGETPKLKTFSLTRAGKAPEVRRRPAYAYWNLAYTFQHKKAEPFLVEVAPDSESKPLNLNTHPGQEFDYVLEGRLLISVGGHEMELEAGDCIYYDSSEPHGMKALGGTRARFLAMIM
ncbi:helix-turn-helix domain-containing protein [Breznakiella homolactica]|uniref:Helix-turn-helix transcriptional regulator n=1 Tax=Breznakiella homolactica TaxID=2798577 RepID=A0A7T8BAE4_9SPIR|nr:cupin domain-containing protein [Breznakiella homolactica]QQO08930.1 cupin domain-containing protein [Breznakiella homolactica]